jgi:hypothetical protein
MLTSTFGSAISRTAMPLPVWGVNEEHEHNWNENTRYITAFLMPPMPSYGRIGCETNMKHMLVWSSLLQNLSSYLLENLWLLCFYCKIEASSYSYDLCATTQTQCHLLLFRAGTIAGQIHRRRAAGRPDPPLPDHGEDGTDLDAVDCAPGSLLSDYAAPCSLLPPLWPCCPVLPSPSSLTVRAPSSLLSDLIFFVHVVPNNAHVLICVNDVWSVLMVILFFVFEFGNEHRI